VSGEDAAARAALAKAASGLHARGFMLATSGNLSAVIDADPLRVLITPSGKDKGELRPEDMLLADASGAIVGGAGKASDELPLHLEIVARTGAGAVVHTHSVWATLQSQAHAVDGGLTLSGYEMLKALRGVLTHRHQEWLPILANAQDYQELRREIARTLAARPQSHGLLLAGHGLYSWGKDLGEALRTAEALEFLLEVEGRSEAARGGS
jgi:methylthioribulose-1-phosphate dehydratase